jgi:hypothetical protein
METPPSSGAHPFGRLLTSLKRSGGIAAWSTQAWTKPVLFQQPLMNGLDAVTNYFGAATTHEFRAQSLGAQRCSVERESCSIRARSRGESSCEFMSASPLSHRMGQPVCECKANRKKAEINFANRWL